MGSDAKSDPLLAQEYFRLQEAVEAFDSRALTIKAWSVTFSAAGLGLAYEQKTPVLLLIAAGSALAFWLVEAMWKVSQQSYYQRIRAIEAHFRGDKATVPLQIAASWHRSFIARGRYRDALRLMAWPHVAMPHVLVAIAGVALWLLARPAS